jgi:O-antigen/teichoic acid export membrane protein
MKYLLFGIICLISGWVIVGLITYIIAFLKGLACVSKDQRLVWSVVMLIYLLFLIPAGPVGLWILLKRDFRIDRL